MGRKRKPEAQGIAVELARAIDKAVPRTALGGRAWIDHTSTDDALTRSKTQVGFVSRANLAYRCHLVGNAPREAVKRNSGPVETRQATPEEREKYGIGR